MEANTQTNASFHALSNNMFWSNFGPTVLGQSMEHLKSLSWVCSQWYSRV